MKCVLRRGILRREWVGLVVTTLFLVWTLPVLGDLDAAAEGLAKLGRNYLEGLKKGPGGSPSAQTVAVNAQVSAAPAAIRSKQAVVSLTGYYSGTLDDSRQTPVSARFEENGKGEWVVIGRRGRKTTNSYTYKVLDDKVTIELPASGPLRFNLSTSRDKLTREEGDDRLCPKEFVLQQP